MVSNPDLINVEEFNQFAVNVKKILHISHLNEYRLLKILYRYEGEYEKVIELV